MKARDDGDGGVSAGADVAGEGEPDAGTASAGAAGGPVASSVMTTSGAASEGALAAAASAVAGCVSLIALSPAGGGRGARVEAELGAAGGATYGSGRVASSLSSLIVRPPRSVRGAAAGAGVAATAAVWVTAAAADADAAPSGCACGWAWACEWPDRARCGAIGIGWRDTCVALVAAATGTSAPLGGSVGSADSAMAVAARWLTVCVCDREPGQEDADGRRRNGP